jgi:hypothetical protein
MIAPDRFYETVAGPPKQGDILFAGVARLVAEDRFTPPAWSRLDAYDVTIAGAREGGGDLRLTAGPALVMATSHDCHFDKEWNRRRWSLLKEGATEEQAERQANDDTSLDRTFTASPLIYPDEPGLDRGNLMAGNIVGYLPVPPHENGLVPNAVVDLTYRVTLDIRDVTRVACVTAEARAQLRYALARLDTLRTTSLGFDIEAVVGRHIEQVTIPETNPLLVQLLLEGGVTIQLLQQPADPAPGPARAG